jgi:hypothetical protein
MTFIQELNYHNAKGYHKPEKYYENYKQILETEGYFVNTKYIDFINNIGFGSFFGGSLVFFPFSDVKGSVKLLTQQISNIVNAEYIVIGYNGTTEGYYCLRRDPNDSSLYWFNLEVKKIEIIDKNFQDWLDKQPQNLFSEQIYAGFKKIKDIESINIIIKERAYFDIEIFNFEKKLCRPPGKENDLLPRYNSVVLAVRKNKKISLLNCLTLKFFRSGSPIHQDNIEYLTINVNNLLIGKSEIINVFLFDPFNLPFDSLTCILYPEIDLSSKMRVRYKEILPFL